MQPAKFALVASLLALAACKPGDLPSPSGAEDFATYCAACHGRDGRGGGEVADTMDKPPADLTQLAAANGGSFPMTRVMSKIWGYAKAPDGTVMPQFAPLLEGDRMVLFDSGDGIDTPTPLRLVQLAQHLQSLQD